MVYMRGVGRTIYNISGRGYDLIALLYPETDLVHALYYWKYRGIQITGKQYKVHHIILNIM